MTEPMTRADRAVTLLAVAGHELNDELTVVVTGISEALARLEPGHAARPFLLDIRAAAQRCCWKTSAMLSYASRKGARQTPAPLEDLLAQGVL
jgi:signal transduction histidine kinase